MYYVKISWSSLRIPKHQLPGWPILFSSFVISRGLKKSQRITIRVATELWEIQTVQAVQHIAIPGKKKEDSIEEEVSVKDDDVFEKGPDNVSCAPLTPEDDDVINEEVQVAISEESPKETAAEEDVKQDDPVDPVAEDVENQSVQGEEESDEKLQELDGSSAFAVTETPTDDNKQSSSDGDNSGENESVASEDVMREDKKSETVLRVVIHSVDGITRETDIVSAVDPFVEVLANSVLLGATKPRQDTTSCLIEEAFFIKTAQSPEKLKLKFQLKDQDHMSEHDLLGHGYFDLSEEDMTEKQTVHLKWKGSEIGQLLISVDFQNITIASRSFERNENRVRPMLSTRTLQTPREVQYISHARAKKIIQG
eukprot:sb/3465884/